MSANSHQIAISRVLSQNSYRGQDVRVIIDRMPCGIWLWEERSRSHVKYDRAELIDFLGVSEDLLDYLENTPILETSWKFINPNRLRQAFAG